MTEREESARLARGWIEAWRRMDMAWLREHLAPGFVHVSPFGRLEGREPYLETVEPMARKSVTELVVRDVVASADRAAVWFENRTPAAVVQSCDWVRVEDGVIREIRSFYDTAGVREVLSDEEQERLEGTRETLAASSEPRLEVTAVEPILAVRDLEEGVDYFADALGFERAWTWGNPPERAGVTRGAASLQLVHDAPFAPDGPSALYLHVRGIDDFYAACVERGAEIVSELADRPFGMRDFRVMDPSGNRIAFGEAVRGESGG